MPAWKMSEEPAPILSLEEKRLQGERMIKLISELITELGGLPSTAYGVAAIMTKWFEEKKSKL